MSDTKHSPTPWVFVDLYSSIRAVKTRPTRCICAMRPVLRRKDETEGVFAQRKNTAKADADFIVLACNHHDELVALAEHLLMDYENAPFHESRGNTDRVLREAVAILDKIKSV